MTLRTSLAVAFLALVAPQLARAQAPAEPQKLTLETSGWLLLNSYGNDGAFEAADLPRFAVARPLEGQSGVGAAVRQSRLRMNLGIPSDGILGGAKLRGFVEGDFMGGRGGDVSTVIPRLRHAYVAASWAHLGNLTLTVGQTWGVAPGPYFASSLSHLAIPRFGGAGFLYRRAPQVRVSGDVMSGAGGLNYAIALLTPTDVAGERADRGNVEARVAGVYKRAGKTVADVGVWSHFGQEKYAVAGVKRTLDARGYGVDAKVEVPYLQLLGGVFTGQNLDVLNSLAGFEATGGTQTANLGTAFVPGVQPVGTNDLRSIETQGAWAQAIVTPMKGLQLLAGAGMEDPKDAHLTASTAGRISRNRQLSGGSILNLTSKWRVSLEYTRYVTDVIKPAGKDVISSNQVELSTLLAL